MVNTHKLELPLSRTYFHGSKGIRAIEVLLYVVVRFGKKSISERTETDRVKFGIIQHAELSYLKLPHTIQVSAGPRSAVGRAPDS